MKRLIAVVGLVVLVGCQAPPAEMTEAEIAQVEAEVNQVLDEAWAVWSAGEDFDRFLTFFADDPETLLMVDAVPRFGKEEIASDFRPVMEGFQRQDNTPVEWRTIVIAPDVVYTVRINDSFQIDLEGNPGPTVRYAETIVWVKRDGEWKMLILHGST